MESVVKQIILRLFSHADKVTSAFVHAATLGTASLHITAAGFFAVLIGVGWFWLLHKKLPRGKWIVVTLQIIAAVFIAKQAEPVLGPDSSSIIIDEFAAAPFLFLVSRPQMKSHSIISTVIILGLFGFLDHFKPLGLAMVERLPAGLGVVADDLAIALLTSTVVWSGFKLFYYTAPR